MATESSQLDQIVSTLSSIQTTLGSGRLFDALEAVRDQVRDLKNQNHEIRNDIMNLQKVVFEQNAGKSSAAD
jgi:flagellar biosynthesis regulator FlbT